MTKRRSAATRYLGEEVESAAAGERTRITMGDQHGSR